MKKFLWGTAALMVAGSLLAACGQAAPTSPPAPPKNTAAPAATAASRPAWQEKWDSVLAEAKREGSITVYGIWGPDTRTALTQAFKDKYGINLEFSPFSRGADLLAKVQAEQRAGLYTADVFGAGNPTLITSMKPEGVLGPIKPLILLPEALDLKSWQGGALPFADKDSTALSLVGTVSGTILYNTDQVKEGELTSYKDLLKPQYKGKITVNDPTVTGSGNAAISHLGYSLWGEAATVDYLKRLVKDQQAVVERDNRVHVEGVARGKYAIGVAPLQAILSEFMGMKAPIKAAKVEEATFVTAGPGAISVPTRSAHPNATIVFVNWLMTKEGSAVFAKSFGNPSTRVDVSTAGIDPIAVPVAGKKYYMETEEVLVARGKWLDIARKAIEEASK